MLDWTNPATAALNEIRTAPLVRFSVLALSSIFFLVDPVRGDSVVSWPSRRASIQRGASAWRARLR